MITDRSLDMIQKFEELTGSAPIEVQAAEEQAANLGKLGRDMERKLAALADCASDDPAREDRFWAAAETVWYYFIQREACGLRDHRQAIRFYGIPKEILLRLGPRPKSG